MKTAKKAVPRDHRLKKGAAGAVGNEKEDVLLLDDDVSTRRSR